LCFSRQFQTKLLYIAIPPLNGLTRAENRERINVFSATGEADLKVNCYKRHLDVWHITPSAFCIAVLHSL